MDLVSVIIPTYKGSECIERAIKSIFNQTYQNIELIVVDDNLPNSDERKKTNNIINRLSSSSNLLIKYVEHSQNLNGAVARNTGFNNSHGDYICFLDDDDVYLPTRVEDSLNEIKRENADIVFSYVAICRKNKLINIVKPCISSDYRKELLFNFNYMGTGSNIFIKRSVFSNVNGFDPGFTRMQDVEFMIRAFANNKVSIVKKVLVVKSTGGANNKPNYSKYCDIRKKFDSKFVSLLEELSNQEQNLYFYNENIYKIKLCLEYNDLKEINKIKKEVIKYGKLKFSVKMDIVLSKIGISKYNLYSFMRLILVPFRNYLKNLYLFMRNRKLKREINNNLL